MDTYKDIFKNNIDELMLINYRYKTGVTYILPFKVTSTDDVHDHYVMLIDLIDGVQHQINYNDILSVEVRESEKNDPVILKGMIDQMKEQGGWYQHNFCDMDSTPNIKDHYRSRYFHSHEGGKVSAEQAYVMVKMKVDTLQELYDMDIMDFKRRWISFMEEYRADAAVTLTIDRDEAHQDGNEEEAEEIEVILEMLSETQDEYISLVEDVETKNDVLKCWPPMLLPFPEIKL